MHDDPYGLIVTEVALLSVFTNRLLPDRKTEVTDGISRPSRDSMPSLLSERRTVPVGRANSLRIQARMVVSFDPVVRGRSTADRCPACYPPEVARPRRVTRRRRF